MLMAMEEAIGLLLMPMAMEEAIGNCKGLKLNRTVDDIIGI